MNKSFASALLAVLALTAGGRAPAQAQAQTLDFKEFSTRGLPGSRGVVVRLQHPAGWKKVPVDDAGALAELRGAQGPLTGILQIGRGRRQPGTQAACQPERARTLLQSLAVTEPEARVTEVFARQHEGRPAYEFRYERNTPPDFLRVRGVIVCLKDSKLLVSCGALGPARAALAAIEPLCRQLLDSVTVVEE